ncbi:uncharacterized protein IL334_004128 [Kwoniella shivajii]|uniref:DNA-(apurinic or apyrimidinic site) lyase n=1 Tax=Kwoniella shivajii TaxID=564305 RepID=A0ABZ1CZH2_9TREE|nr:hypothetical protein IL334_004128 [Kwoniella shivajii]
MSRPPFPSGWSSIPLSLKNLTLVNTLPVGQSFLWHRHAEEFSRAVDDPPRVVCLRQLQDRLYYAAIHLTNDAARLDKEGGLTHRWIQEYFQLDKYPDLETMYADWRLRDPELFGKVEVNERAVGVRVVRQDPWECLIAITSLLHRFSHAFAPPVMTLDNPDDTGFTTYHLFPSPSSLPVKLETLLREMGFGYRAAFIESTLQALREEFKDDVEGGLESWRGMDVNTVREKLVALKGVGRKVADCVMLMCMDKAFLLEKWGPMGGWCQAVMFAADLPMKAKVTKIAVKNLKRTRSGTRIELRETIKVEEK